MSSVYYYIAVTVFETHCQIEPAPQICEAPVPLIQIQKIHIKYSFLLYKKLKGNKYSSVSVKNNGFSVPVKLGRNPHTIDPHTIQ